MPAAGDDGGGQHGGQGLRGVVGVVPVAGQAHHAGVGGDEGRVGLQGLGVVAVEPRAFAGQQVVGDGLADQGVPEAVAVAGPGDGEEVGTDGGPERLDEVVLGELGDGGDQPVLHREPPSATMRATRWALSGRASTRTRSRSRRESLRAVQLPSAPATASSSMKKALPSERA